MWRVFVGENTNFGTWQFGYRPEVRKLLPFYFFLFFDLRLENVYLIAFYFLRTWNWKKYCLLKPRSQPAMHLSAAGLRRIRQPKRREPYRRRTSPVRVLRDAGARSGYWTVCNNCCGRCVSCGNVADTCVQRTAVHLRRALPVRFGRPANANLMPAGTSTAVPPTCVPGATDVRVTQRTQPPHTCSAANVHVTHLAGTLEARRACFRWG